MTKLTFEDVKLHLDEIEFQSNSPYPDMNSRLDELHELGTIWEQGFVAGLSHAGIIDDETRGKLLGWLS